MCEIIEQIVNLENLKWAWGKAKYALQPDSLWFDEIEVAEFETHLNLELDRIKEDIVTGRYRVNPIKPVAFPKSPDDNGPRARQTFYVSLRDQVAWLAITNIIGPALDYQMPFWSYGNRLYMSIFFENTVGEDKKVLKFGWYRHSAHRIYRKWNQSWPLYRRHIAITTKIMSKLVKFKNNENKFIEDELQDERERDVYDQNKKNPKFLKVKYLERDYWDQNLSGEIYWVGFDLKKFFPSIKSDIILKSIERYLPEEKKSKALDTLLKEMLSFPLNTSGWTKRELNDIGLEKGQELFNRIPTGLLVDGFLANVAMMQVDKQISQGVESERNIALFKFVDDHVILTDNFEKLDEWTKRYMRILEEMDMGVKLNDEKFEPKALCEFFKNNRDSTNNNIKKVQNRAKKEAKLDPDFPSPLMTQTLTKVSKIMNTEFDLLEANEEEQLLGDIEHLLVTDFPDQEWRRDTRISWAATMISLLVPKKQVDIGQLIELEEQVIKLEAEIKELGTKSGNRRSEKLKEMTRIKSKKMELEENLRKEEEKQIRHSMKLLLKAVHENHDKRKLWKRIIEFSRKVGYNDLISIIDLIDRLKTEKIVSELTSEYIYSLVLGLFATDSITAYMNVVNRKNSFKKRERSSCFLNSVMDENFITKVIANRNNLKFYHRKSRLLFKFVIGTIHFLLRHPINLDSFGMDLTKKLREKEILEFGVIDWDANVLNFFSKRDYDIGVWGWWILKKISDPVGTCPNLLWGKLLEYFIPGKATKSTPVFWEIISLYPSKIPENLFEYLNRTGNKIIENDGLIFDVLIGMRKSGKTLFTNVKSRQIKRILKIVDNDKNISGKGYISLYEWIDWVREKFYTCLDEFPGGFDPRFSEWTALEIIRQISEEIIKKSDIRFLILGNEIFKCVHPYNYLIPEDWKNLKEITWEKWRDYVEDKTNRIKFQKNSKNFIRDSRYTPKIVDTFNIDEKVLSVLYGLGLLLIGILKKSFEFPPTMNSSGKIMDLGPFLTQFNREYPVSSRTLGIIKTCLSKRNHETKLLKQFQNYQDFSPDDDTLFDPPEILTLEDLISNIKKSQRILKNFQLTVHNHLPRQLIPLSVVQLTREYNPYQDIENRDGVDNE